MGELSSGLLKSDRSPAAAGDTPNPPETIVSPSKDMRGSESKFNGIDPNSNPFEFLKRHRPPDMRAMRAIRSESPSLLLPLRPPRPPEPCRQASRARARPPGWHS